jgi:hypothetical protein
MSIRTLPPGPFTAATARQFGITRHQLSVMVQSRLVRQILTGVYVDRRLEDTPDLRIAAAALVLLPHRVFCDRTAAWLHGVDVFDYRELEIPAPVEMWVLSGHSRVRRTGTEGGQRDLWPDEIMTLGGIRLTVPLRTVMDLACTLPRGRALAALDAFMREHGITREDMEAALPRFAGRRGVVQLRELVPIGDPRAESPGESLTRLAILDDSLPAPEPQFWVIHQGREIFRLDLAYPKSKVAVEYDGVEFHDDDPERREADEKRRAWLREHGWIVIVVRKGDFTAERRHAWLGELRRALRVH